MGVFRAIFEKETGEMVSGAFSLEHYLAEALKKEKEAIGEIKDYERETKQEEINEKKGDVEHVAQDELKMIHSLIVGFNVATIAVKDDMIFMHQVMEQLKNIHKKDITLEKMGFPKAKISEIEKNLEEAMNKARDNIVTLRYIFQGAKGEAR